MKKIYRIDMKSKLPSERIKELASTAGNTEILGAVLEYLDENYRRQQQIIKDSQK